MARTVKPEAVAAKRREILDAAQRLVFSKGYEQMSIQDILDEVQISSGAFHHYFDSRKALLDAFIERIKQEIEEPLLSIIDDPTLTAIEKFQRFFSTLDRLRMERRAEILQLGRIWYADTNAIVRLRVDEAVHMHRAPLLARIVHQGVQEGLFTSASADKAGEVIMSLLQGMGNTHSRLLLLLGQKHDDDQHLIAEIVATHVAYMDAIERVLGAPAHAFFRTNAEAVQVWVTTLREETQA